MEPEHCPNCDIDVMPVEVKRDGEKVIKCPKCKYRFDLEDE